MLEKREFEKNDFLWRLSSAITVVTGLFSLVVFLLMVINYLQVMRADPVDNLLLTKMRQQYAALPEKDVALAERIRELDQLNRKAFFTSQAQLRTGAIILLVGVSVFLISFKFSLRYQRETPQLEEVPTADKEFLAFAQSRQMIMWAGVGILAVGMAATVLTESTVAKQNAPVTPGPDAVAAKAGEAKPGETQVASNTQAATVQVNVPAWDAIEKNWPSFRGPGSGGVAHFTNAPTNWDIPSGKGVKWKAEIALPGANSPVIWEKRLFVSGADDKKREIYCYDTETGKLLWSQAVDEPAGTTPPKVSEDTGFAAPSMVAHGGLVFAIFADGVLVAYDMDGKKIWSQNLGVPDNHYGHSSSLLAYDKLLYVQLDQKKDPKLLALDIATGKEVWVAKRKTISWASPIIAQTDFGPQLILNSEETVDAYDPIKGTQLWSQECLSGEVAPSPAYGKGIVFAANEYATAAAIQLEKSDAGIAPKIIWQFDELLPEVSSPVGDGERFYFGTASGALVCLDAKTGQKLWVEELPAGFYSSPIIVGDKLFIGDKEGEMYIVQAASTYNLIAKIALGAGAFATPAYMDGRIYMRIGNNLYCIEQANA